mmetsp:Transcript_24911/g.36737  ORF Transcript_24911/g.36737 Transcript_24911/m.36737 type:complete len:130 (-) Transcript_24911:35-424(-)
MMVRGTVTLLLGNIAKETGSIITDRGGITAQGMDAPVPERETEKGEETRAGRGTQERETHIAIAVIVEVEVGMTGAVGPGAAIAITEVVGVESNQYFLLVADSKPEVLLFGNAERVYSRVLTMWNGCIG